MATDKQISYIAFLARKQGKTLGDVIFDYTGEPSFNIRRLRRDHASDIITQLLNA
jgi:hypothetical protein